MKLISFFTFFIYGMAILIALWPVVGLVLDPGDKGHLVRFIFCPLVALGIAAVGKLFSLICQALYIYIQRNILYTSTSHETSERDSRYWSPRGS